MLTGVDFFAALSPVGIGLVVNFLGALEGSPLFIASQAAFTRAILSETNA